MLQKLITAAVLLITFPALIMSSPQRPSFAGGRPSGGLNQKDKYHQQVQQEVNVTIDDRFSEIEANRLPPNASQRPPVGVPVVQPLPVYEPLPAVNVPLAFDNRIGGTDNIPQQPTQAPVLPLDALGDRELFNYLSALPEHQRPFWFLNYQAIQAHRNSSAPFSGAIASSGSFFG